jgi:hypothetical protein
VCVCVCKYTSAREREICLRTRSRAPHIDMDVSPSSLPVQCLADSKCCTIQGSVAASGYYDGTAGAIPQCTWHMKNASSALKAVQNFVMGIVGASRDLRWMQIHDEAIRVVGGGRPANWRPTVAKDALMDIYKRISDVDMLSRAMASPEFSQAAAELKREMMRPFAAKSAVVPRAGAVEEDKHAGRNKNEEEDVEAGASCTENGKSESQEKEIWSVRCMQPGLAEVLWHGPPSSSSPSSIVRAVLGEGGASTGSCYYSGRKLDPFISLKEQGLVDGCCILLRVATGAQEGEDGGGASARGGASGGQADEVPREEVGGGLLAALDRCSPLYLSHTAYSLAMALNGSAGGGHEVGLMYR